VQSVQLLLAASGAGNALTGVRPGAHHFDRAFLHTSGDYTDLPKDRRITISTNRKENPYDSAFCESFRKTLKHDEVRRQEDRDLAEARLPVGTFMSGSTTRNGFTRPSATVRRPTLKTASVWQQERGHESNHALYQAWRNLSLRCVITSCTPGPKRRAPDGSGPSRRACRKFPRPTHRRDESRLAIPQRCAPALPVSASPSRPCLNPLRDRTQ
jgi:hypothetical protein